MNNICKFFPVSYTVYSRIRGIKELMSWIYLFPAYCMILTLVYGSDNNFLFFPIIFIAIISLYEIGYLFNDVKSIKNESNPTKRINDPWIFNNFKKLVIARLCYIIFFSCVLYFYIDELIFSRYILFLSLLGFAFYIHNKIRGRTNVFTFCILSFLKYAATLVLIKDFEVFYLTFLAFPLLRTIEYCAIKGYCKKIESIAFSLHEFRVFYYFIFSFLLVLFLIFDAIDFSYIFIPFYFLIYRLLVLMYTRKDSKKNDF